MKEQMIVWTALPNGRIPPGNRLRLSVFVAPRLLTNEGLPTPTLQQFPDFLDWPATPLQFRVEFRSSNAGAPVIKVAATRVGPPPRSDLWKALFKPSTYVRPHTFDPHHERRIRSYPALDVMSLLKNQYLAAIKGDPEEFPAVTSLVQSGLVHIGFWPDLGDDDGRYLTETRYIGELEALLTQKKAVGPGDYAGDSEPKRNAKDFLQLKLFHRPRTPKEKPAVIKVPDVDFHQMLSSAGQYPQVLRWLGLVHDLELPFQPAVVSYDTVQVVPIWTPKLPSPPPPAPPTTANRSPRTRYGFALGTPGLKFNALPSQVAPELQNGRLALADPKRYGVVQVDLDGAAIKTMDFANTLRRATSPDFTSADKPERLALPAFRSAGLSLVRAGQARALHEKFKAAKTKNDQLGSADPVLSAEELVRGYRVDVWDNRSGRWHTLHRRLGTYRFTDANLTETLEEEGYTSLAPTGKAGDNSPTADLSLQESLFLWAGWSLVGPRPNRAIDSDGRARDVANQAATPFKLEARFKAKPGSLPALRTGRVYQLVARAVDLAGNSLPLTPSDAPAPAEATAKVLFCRWEPVPTPARVMRRPAGRGESADFLVIRSNFNTAAAGDTQRHIVPPKAAEQRLEWDGFLDTANGLDKTAYERLKAKVDGSFESGGTPDPNNYGQRYYDVDTLTLPYLPDGFAQGAAWRGLPGVPNGQVFQTDFAGGAAWPAARPIRLVVEEGAFAPPAFDPGTNVLRVRLPKAEVANVRLSAYLPDGPGFLDRLGTWRWLKDDGGLPPARLAALEDKARKGLLWFLTPYQELTLVHAVQQPLVEPTWEGPTSARDPGKTFADVRGGLRIDGKSTGKVDVLAEWTEMVDAVTKPGPEKISGRAHVGELLVRPTDTLVPLPQPVPGDSRRKPLRHELGDTKYRQVQYSIVATTRFREHFSEGTTPITRQTAAPATLNVLNASRPAAPKVLYVVPTFGWERTALGSTVSSNRRGNGLRVYLDRPWFSSGDGEQLGVVVGDIRKELEPYITRWGSDPLWRAADAPGPNVVAFIKRNHATTGVRILAEQPNIAVGVVPYDVAYDANRRLWYADIEMDLGDAYYPFIRLALVRHQPNSLEGVHISRVVLTDFAQLAPDRSASISFESGGNPSTVLVAVTGPGYAKPGNPDQIDHRMEVAVQQRNPNVPGELGWVGAPTPGRPDRPLVFALTPAPSGSEAGLTTWTGTVTLPQPREARPFRLVIREFELFSAGRGPGGQVLPRAERLVYADAVELS